MAGTTDLVDDEPGRIMMGPPKGSDDDEEVATQQPVATQEAGLATQQLNVSELSAGEELDIICTLCPTNPAAFEMVSRAYEDTPQHVFRHSGISRQQRVVLETYDREDSMGPTQQATPEITGNQVRDAPGEFALRMTSEVRDMDLGFVFGRDKRKSDIVLELPGQASVRVSGMHFRIFLNDNGLIMIEDTSTNGTMVDSNLLKFKKPVVGNSVRRILSNGSIIEIYVDDNRRTARFLIKIPERRDEPAWKNVLSAYVSAIKRVRAQKTADLRNLGRPQANGGARPAVQVKAEAANHQDNADFLTAGTMPFNHGMRWNGGGKYKIVAKIGAGAFAIVYGLVDIRSGAPFAAKELDKRRFMKNGVLDIKMHNELNIMKRIDHQHTVRSFEHHDTPRDLIIIMEHVPFGDLSQHLGKTARLSDDDHRAVAKQMCHALAYLHDNAIAHRDIKPDNILKKAISPIWVKLTDFGLSKVISQGDNTVYQTFCGTLLYLAPEVYPGWAQARRGEAPDPRRHRSDPYSVAVDIWSLGAVMFHLVCGVEPYRASGANHGVHMLEEIFAIRFPEKKFIKSAADSDWESFFMNTLALSPSERWSARKLLTLPFMLRVPDVVDIEYDFKMAMTSMAFEEDSSDEEMTGLQSIIEEQIEPIDTGVDIDASQLSIHDPVEIDEESDEDDDEMVESKEEESTGHGLGIQLAGAQMPAGSHLQSQEGSRYNLRTRSGPPRQPTLSSPQKRKGTSKQTSLTPAVTQQPGKLFGEIAESGVFGSAANMPHIVGALNSTSLKQVAHVTTTNGLYQAANLGGNFSHAVSHADYHAAGSAVSLGSADAHDDNASMIAPDSEVSFGHGSNSVVSASTSIKHHLADEDEPIEASSKRGKFATAKRTVPASTRVVSNQETGSLEPELDAAPRPVTPDAGMDVDTAEELTPRPRRKLVSESETIPPGALRPDNLPRAAVAQSFPNPRGCVSSAADQDADVSATSSDSLAMPPPARRPSTSSSRPSTPSFRADPKSIVSALGVLTPGHRSIPVDAIHITLAATEWGRAPGCTHVYPYPNDVRVPKCALAIHLWDPKAGRRGMNDPNTDWTKCNFYAVVSTRSSRPIYINGVPLARKSAGDDKFPLGLLRSGDKISIFNGNDNDKHLNFYARFWFGAASKQRDGEDDDFQVLFGEDALQTAIAKDIAKRSNGNFKA